MKLELTQAIVVATTAIYVTGFVVVNSQLAGYTVPMFSVRNGRNIAAGLLFFGWIAGPVIVAAGISRISIWVIRVWHKPRPVYVLAIGTLLALSGAAQINKIMLAPNDRNRSMASLGRVFLPQSTVVYSSELTVYFVIIGIFACIWIYYSDIADRLEARMNISRRGMTNGLILTTAVYAVILASIFGGFVYGGIDPAFGGGAPWVACLQLNPEARTDSVLRSQLLRPVAVFDRDDRLITFVPLSDNYYGRSVPLSLIQLMVVFRPVAAPIGKETSQRFSQLNCETMTRASGSNF